MEENPVLISCKSLKPLYVNVKQIVLNSRKVSIGRGLNNDVVIPFISISRNHCVFRKSDEDEWTVEDASAFGIEVNGHRLGKGVTSKISHEDIITLEPSKEFVYKFVESSSDTSEIPKKRIKLEQSDSDFITNVKIRFEESQFSEIKHIEDKIQGAKQMQTTSMILKEQVKLDMNRKIQQLETDFATQIENLKGEKNEVERQKVLLIEERDSQLKNLKQEMEGKITELMDQIHKHNETESELLKENSLLKDKLVKERDEFLSELSRENTSKQDMLEKLEGKIREQEEIRLKEKQELEVMLRQETEQLRLAKEKELKELEELKRQREEELGEELNNIKRNLEEQVKQTEQQKLLAEQQLNQQKEHLQKLSDEEKIKRDHLLQDREEIQKKLTEAQSNAEKSIEQLKAQVQEREIELAALAAERIQQQAEQSGMVISSLQEQLEKVRSELQSVETEKNTLLESLCLSDPLGEGTSTETTLAKVGELMESELQCSICAELFVAATTLSCSHTFCKYCITMWKKKKKDCPICRSPIASECKSLVLDSFIEKMVENLTEDMKKKREDLLKFREELESQLTRHVSADSSRRSGSYDASEYYNSDSGESEEEYGGEEYGEEEYSGYEDYEDFNYWGRRQRYYDESDTDGRSDDDPDTTNESSSSSSRASTTAGDANGRAAGDASGGAAGDASGGAAGTAPTPAVSNNTAGPPERTNTNDGGRRRARRGREPGLPGIYYGGYGRCFSCGARGHWAPGCPHR